MATKIDPKSYLIAPLFAPTLHIFLTPIWAIVSNRMDRAFEAMAWQTIAWFALEAICLATMTPLLWLIRNQVSKLTLRRSTAWSIATLCAMAASYLLFRSALLSWFASFTSAAVIFAQFQIHESPSQQTTQPESSANGRSSGRDTS
jgi:hypothetical protein